MAKGIGSLAAILSLNSKQFNAGIREAEKRVNGLSANTSRAEVSIRQSVANKNNAFKRLNQRVTSSTGQIIALRAALMTHVAAASAVAAAIHRLATGYHRAQEEAARFSLTLGKMSSGDAVAAITERMSELETWLGGRGLDQFQLRMRSMLTGEWQGQEAILKSLQRQLELYNTLANKERERNKLAEDGKRIAEQRAAFEAEQARIIGVADAARQKRGDMEFEKFDDLRTWAKDLQDQLETEGMSPAERLQAEADKRLQQLDDLRNMGEGATPEEWANWAKLEEQIRDSLARGLAEIAAGEVEADVPTGGPVMKENIAALVRGSAETEAFAFDSQQRKQVDIAAKHLKAAELSKRELAAIRRAVEDDTEVVVNF